MSLIDYDLRSAASYTQKRNRSCYWGNNRTHYMYFSGSGRWKHACIQDLTANSCYNRRPSFPRVFLVIVFLSTSIILTSYNLILQESRCSNLFSVISIVGLRGKGIICTTVVQPLCVNASILNMFYMNQKNWQLSGTLIEALTNLDSRRVSPI